jgi:carotenoid cleavage dioxygenase-like enzyme
MALNARDMIKLDTVKRWANKTRPENAMSAAINSPSLNSQNPYLQGMYQAVATESTLLNLTVVGEIPKDFRGSYVRNGPNPRRQPTTMHHWFDGDGMVHSVYFEDGKAEYRNRYVRSDDFLADEQGHCIVGGVMERANNERAPKVYKDTANTDVILHNGQLMGLWYISGEPVRMDARTLETLGQENFGGQLPRHVSAHSKMDPVTGEFLFFDYALYEPWMSCGVVDKNNNLQNFKTIELPGPRLPHDMAFTQNYMILHDLPVVFTEQAIRQKQWSIEIADQATRFGVVPRNGEGAVRWFETEPCYIYHVINAWEEADEVVMLGCKMVPNPHAQGKEFGPYRAMVEVLALNAVLCEWRMNLKSGKCTSRNLDDAISEFPAINLNHAGQKNRFGYIQSIAPTNTLKFDGIYKYDFNTDKREAYWYEPGVFGSEVAFAPRINAKTEDDGYLLGFCINEKDLSSELRIWNAQAIEDGPVARIMLPVTVPAGFHATWADGSEFSKGREGR